MTTSRSVLAGSYINDSVCQIELLNMVVHLFLLVTEVVNPNWNGRHALYNAISTSRCSDSEMFWRHQLRKAGLATQVSANYHKE
jgi:hypothetical protein